MSTTEETVAESPFVADTTSPPDITVNAPDEPPLRSRIVHISVTLLLGQLLSFLISGTAITSEVLQRHGVNIPTAQSFLNYYLLALTFGSYSFYRLGRANTLCKLLKENWWKYLLGAVIDVEANYLIVKAYQYTSITSVQLLDSLSIPTCLLVSYWLLKVRFRISHYVGVGTALVGVAGIILSDWFTLKNSSELPLTNPILGDIFVISGAILYGISNVWQEYLVRKYEKILYIGFIGVFGSFVNGIQLVILERENLSSFQFTKPIVLSMIGFAVCMYLLYVLMPIAMSRGSSILVNLSLLTSDVYALLLGVYMFHYVFHPVYIISFVVVVCGVVVYVIRVPSVVHGFTIVPQLFTKLSDRRQKLSPENGAVQNGAANIWC